MKKLKLIFMLILLLTSFQNKTKKKLPKGFWKIISLNNKAHHKSLCGFYFDDSIAMKYCIDNGKRVARYIPANDIKANFMDYYEYQNYEGDTIEFILHFGESVFFRLCKDTLFLENKYQHVKFVKDNDQATPILVEPDSIYYPYNLYLNNK
jgi:hypothetical protein